MVVLAIPRVHEHWLQPVLFVLPLYMFLRRPSASPEPRRLRIFAVVVVTALGLLAGWRLAEAWAGHRVGAYSRLNVSYGEVGRRIAEAGFREGVIVTDHHLVGGSLRFVLPGTTVITARMAEAGATIPPGPCLVAWDASSEEGIPPALVALARSGGQAVPPPRYVEARGGRAERGRVRLGFMALPTCQR